MHSRALRLRLILSTVTARCFLLVFLLRSRLHFALELRLEFPSCFFEALGSLAELLSKFRQFAWAYVKSRSQYTNP